MNSTDKKLELDGGPKDALNFPDQNKIIFNKDSWNSSDLEKKQKLVFHELLGVLKIDDSKYVNSLQLIQAEISGTSNTPTGIACNCSLAPRKNSWDHYIWSLQITFVNLKTGNLQQTNLATSEGYTDESCQKQRKQFEESGLCPRIPEPPKSTGKGGLRRLT